MAGGLVGLLDDIASLAKLAAASVDDIGAAAGRSSVKAAGVVIDDTAVTPAYVRDLAAERELPIIRRIAKGSLRNKLLLILPAALILSEISPTLVEALLMTGGAYLCYEGAHKVIHAIGHRRHRNHHVDEELPATTRGPEAESAVVAGAVRTDFVLSAEIMVIALKEVLDEPVVSRGIILAIVGVLVTIGVYGVVALIVKMDDAGLRLAERESPTSQRLGRALVTGMPKVLQVLSVVGTAAMLWVGGHILVAGSHELGWESPEAIVHDLSHGVDGVAGIGGVLGWLVGTAASAAVGFVVGAALVAIVAAIPKRGAALSG
jgi:predicted DNA repair protein MutK